VRGVYMSRGVGRAFGVCAHPQNSLFGAMPCTPNSLHNMLMCRRNRNGKDDKPLSPPPAASPPPLLSPPPIASPPPGTVAPPPPPGRGKRDGDNDDSDKKEGRGRGGRQDADNEKGEGRRRQKVSAE
jgi:hypothetical protein